MRRMIREIFGRPSSGLNMLTIVRDNGSVKAIDSNLMQQSISFLYLSTSLSNFSSSRLRLPEKFQ